MNLLANKYFGWVFAALLWCLCFWVVEAQAAEVLSVVKVHIPGYSTGSLPFLISDELGFYREEGIRIELTRIQTGSGIQALVADVLKNTEIR